MLETAVKSAGELWGTRQGSTPDGMNDAYFRSCCSRAKMEAFRVILMRVYYSY